MRILFSLLLIAGFVFIFGSCGSSSSGPLFCDTTCNNDTIRFSGTHTEKPFVSVSIKNCMPDTIIWSHQQLATNRKSGFVDLVGKTVRMNRQYVSAYFKDTSYAWLKFNDCITGRGFLVKLPYNKSDKWSIYTSALNDFDPKFKVENGMIAYYDETFVYAQNMENGKVDRMLLHDKKLDIDHNKVHDTFDSIYVSPKKIWANIKINGQWKSKEKSIDL